MNLAVIGHKLVVDVKGASRSKGARAILWSANGASNQQFLHDEMGRLIPQHCPDNILDVKGDEIVWGAPLIFWPIKVPASPNQQFHLDESGRLVAGGGGGDLAVGSAELSSGAQLTLVPKSSSRALTLEWREAPPPTPESPNEAASPPQRKSFWSRLGGNSATNSNNESSSSSKAPPPPSNASSSSSGSREGEKQGKAPQTSKESSAPSGGGGEEGGKGDGGEGAIPEALAQALAADNYYESLGISASEKAALNDAKVRRAYLKTSVKVHPDKHPSHPQEATVAFQRVSEAYAGLQDDGARRDYEAELRNTFGRGGHRGCSPSSSSSSSSSANGGGGGGGGARGGTRRGNSQHQPWYQSSDGVSYKEAAAFFAAAFAAEAAAGQMGGLGGNLGKSVKVASDVAEFGATLKMAEGLLNGEGSTAHRVASGLMVANSVANLSSHLELLGPSAGRLGAGLGTFARAATAAVAVGSMAVAAREHGRLEAQKEQAAAERYYTGGQSSSYSDDDDDDNGDRGRGRPAGSKNMSKPSQYYPPETEF